MEANTTHCCFGCKEGKTGSRSGRRARNGCVESWSKVEKQSAMPLCHCGLLDDLASPHHACCWLARPPGPLIPRAPAGSLWTTCSARPTHRPCRYSSDHTAALFAPRINLTRSWDSQVQTGALEFAIESEVDQEVDQLIS